MLEEKGHVVALEPNAVWVEVVRGSTCSSCSKQSGCGQSVMELLGVGQKAARLRVSTDLCLTVGDWVVIGVPERTLVRSAVLLYLLPLLGLLAGAGMASYAQWPEPITVLCSVLGFLLCIGVVRLVMGRRCDNTNQQPVILRAELSVLSLP